MKQPGWPRLLFHEIAAVSVVVQLRGAGPSLGRKVLQRFGKGVNGRLGEFGRTSRGGSGAAGKLINLLEPLHLERLSPEKRNAFLLDLQKRAVEDLFRLLQKRSDNENEVQFSFSSEKGAPREQAGNSSTSQRHSTGYYSCFLSYAHQDHEFTRHLHADLQCKGVHCWFAPHDMKIGDKIRLRIDESILAYDKLLIVLSEYSVASSWVEHEVETALARESRDRCTILFPIRLDDAILRQAQIGWPALVQNERHIGDFTNWKNDESYQIAFSRLLHDLQKADEEMA